MLHEVTVFVGARIISAAEDSMPQSRYLTRIGFEPGILPSTHTKTGKKSPPLRSFNVGLQTMPTELVTSCGEDRSWASWASWAFSKKNAWNLFSRNLTRSPALFSSLLHFEKDLKQGSKACLMLHHLQSLLDK